MNLVMNALLSSVCCGIFLDMRLFGLLLQPILKFQAQRSRYTACCCSNLFLAITRFTNVQEMDR